MTAKVVVRASIAPMHAESRVSSPQTSQRLAGHIVEVREVVGDWLLVRGEDGYDGWMHRGYVVDGSGARSTDAARQTLSLGCVARDAATGSSRALPLAAWLAPGEHRRVRQRDRRSGSGHDVSRGTPAPSPARPSSGSRVRPISGEAYSLGRRLLRPHANRVLAARRPLAARRVATGRGRSMTPVPGRELAARRPAVLQ